MTHSQTITADILFVMVLVTTILAISWMGYQDLQKEHEIYCKMVAEGTWPDYKGLYQNTCQAQEK